MPLTVRPARKDDLTAARLLYMSAQPYYEAYTGSGRRALKLLASLWPQPGHTASYEQCRVAVLDGEIVGVLAVFRTDDGDALAARHGIALSDKDRQHLAMHRRAQEPAVAGAAGLVEGGTAQGNLGLAAFAQHIDRAVGRGRRRVGRRRNAADRDGRPARSVNDLSHRFLAVGNDR